MTGMLVSAAVSGCSTAERSVAPEPESSVDSSETGTWLRVVGAWPERVTLPTAGTVDCTRHSSDHGYGYRAFDARTSDFTEYDAGGERPGHDFDVSVYIPNADNDTDNTDGSSSSHVMVQFSDPQGRFFRLTGSGTDDATITPSPDGTSVSFEVTGSATSIDADPLLVRAAGRIHCDAVTEQTY
ncbi:hypothetical protein [Prescottella sp. R16]|uniref:hypothetical protein n=1 Tax=Prescottella sp. R16 TaxID=3064529 RepID=UPI00272E8867|nr:hypothetical protein [Prescottella sp. R16]